MTSKKISVNKDSELSDAARFFSEAGRGKALLHIISLARSSAGIILLMGEEGSGRSFLLERLYVRANQKPALMGLINQVVKNRADLFHAIAAAFSVKLVGNETQDSLEERVMEFLQGSYVTHRPVILAVSGIQLFSLNMLEELLKLLKRYKKISLLLVGDMNLSAMLKRLDTEKTSPREVVLNPLSAGEIRQFVNWRLSFLLEQREFNDLVHTTRGNFALLEREARKKEIAHEALLANKKSFLQQIKNVDRRIWITCAMLLVLAAAVVVYTNVNEPAPAVAKVKIPPKEKIVPEIEVAPKVEVIPEVKAVPEMEVVPKVESVPKIEVVPKPIPEVEVVPEVRIVPEVKVVSKMEIAPKMEVAPEVSASVEDDAAARVMSLPPKHYTLQLLAAKSRKNLAQFLSEHTGLGELWVVRTERDGADWYVVLYGDYAGWKESQAGIAALPEDVKAISPWARRVSEVQALMKPE